MQRGIIVTMAGTPETNLRLALDLFEAGEAMMRQNLRRAHPDATEEELRSMLVRWLMDRPSHADADGFRRRALPR